MFTQEEIKQIQRRLANTGVKDSSFANINSDELDNTTSLSVLHNQNNRQLNIDELKKYINEDIEITRLSKEEFNAFKVLNEEHINSVYSATQDNSRDINTLSNTLSNVSNDLNSLSENFNTTSNNLNQEINNTKNNLNTTNSNLNSLEESTERLINGLNNVDNTILDINHDLNSVHQEVNSLSQVFDNYIQYWNVSCVVTPENAVVYMNGIKTNILTNVFKGSHIHIKAELDGYKTYETHVVVENNDLQVPITLIEKQTVTLTVESDSGSNIFINNNYTSTYTGYLGEIVNILVIKDGHFPYIETYKLSKTETKTVSLYPYVDYNNLSPEPSILAFGAAAENKEVHVFVDIHNYMTGVTNTQEISNDCTFLSNESFVHPTTSGNISCDANPTTSSRTAIITVEYKGLSTIIRVTQEGQTA